MVGLSQLTAGQHGDVDWVVKNNLSWWHKSVIILLIWKLCSSCSTFDMGTPFFNFNLIPVSHQSVTYLVVALVFILMSEVYLGGPSVP